MVSVEKAELLPRFKELINRIEQIFCPNDYLLCVEVTLKELEIIIGIKEIFWFKSRKIQLNNSLLPTLKIHD